MWVLPDTQRVRPGYEQLDINKELIKGGLVPIASGRGHNAAISIRQKNAVLWGSRLKPKETVALPVSPFAHLFVARGSGSLDQSGPLHQGDAARLRNAGSLKFTADSQGAELLVWESNPTNR
jgi:redox-sensitive bicupin YhaK (pirin superfamily)